MTTSGLQLFAPCPLDLLPGAVPGAPSEPCTDSACGLRSDHPGSSHARLSVRGTVMAIWSATELTPSRTSALAELLAVSAALIAAAESAESVATRLYAEHGDDPVLRRLCWRFLSRLPRTDYLPTTTTRQPGREWRELLEDAARHIAPREVTS